MKTYRTSPPAKLNLFLEILGRREDGFHELDTVMVAIDWRDELAIRPTPDPGIHLNVDWLPDRSVIAGQLGVDCDHPLLEVPDDERNLVHRALSFINQESGYDGGWDVDLGKRIPSGAGMGGASSDAAATLRLAARALADLDPKYAAKCSHTAIFSMAERLGSDVPFFLNPDSGLARATGRGENLEFFDLPRLHRFAVIYPAISLSTADVYRNCVVSESIRSSDSVIDAFCNDMGNPDEKILYNALQRSACGLAPRVGEALDCLSDKLMLQSSMTGSGSACFVWAADPDHSSDQLTELIEDLNVKLKEDGALIRAVTTCKAASEIQFA